MNSRALHKSKQSAQPLAVEAAQNMGHRYVGTEHVLYGLAAEGSGVAAAALEQCGISAQTVQSKIAATSGTGAQTRLPPMRSPPEQKSFTDGGVHLRQDGTELCGNRAPASRVNLILSRRTKNNPVLIGEPGVGKTAVAEGLSLKSPTAQCPKSSATRA